jgi:cytochrome c553
MREVKKPRPLNYRRAPRPLDTATSRLRELRTKAWRFLSVGAFAVLTISSPPASAVEDTMAQRVLACTGCHGKEGRAARDGYYPRIAGKPEVYLFEQLLSFRDGRRQYAPMSNLLQPLTDDYLREIARHFASLDLPYAAQPVATSDAAMLSRGESLVVNGDPARKIPACVSCHGGALTGVAPAIPGLIGLPRDYLNAQLGAWQSGNRRARDPDCMAQIARALTPQDVEALTQWLASRPMPASTHPATSLPQPLPMHCGAVEAVR